MNKLITDIKSTSLPGQQAQLKMAALPKERLLKQPSDQSIEAAVLHLFYYKNDELHFALMQRTSHFKEDKHKGQISYPGGRRDLKDKSLQETALRETEEEFGVCRNEIKTIKSLTDLYIPVSGYHVFPFIGIHKKEIKFIPDKSEVESIIEIPLKELMNENNVQFKNMKMPNGFTLKNVPYYNLNNKVVWGATAMILSEVKELIKTDY